MLGVGNGYSGCHQIRSVEERKEEGGVGMEGGCNKRAGFMGGEISALGGTKHMGSEKVSGRLSGPTLFAKTSPVLSVREKAEKP